MVGWEGAAKVGTSNSRRCWNLPCVSRRCTSRVLELGSSESEFLDCYVTRSQVGPCWGQLGELGVTGTMLGGTGIMLGATGSEWNHAEGNWEQRKSHQGELGVTGTTAGVARSDWNHAGGNWEILGECWRQLGVTGTMLLATGIMLEQLGSHWEELGVSRSD